MFLYGLFALLFLFSIPQTAIDAVGTGTKGKIKLEDFASKYKVSGSLE
jgi:hypothetical protein